MRGFKISTRLAVVVAGLLLFAFLAGRFMVGAKPSAGQQNRPATPHKSNKTRFWTCSMHPQIRLPRPGKCPVCGMDLIPVTGDDGAQLGPRMMRMSEAAMKLAEIQTQPVERRFVDLEVPLVGKVDYDETRVKTIAAWVPGRLERLFVDYTGIPVKQGDHLVRIYSPKLYSAQEELLQAIKAAAKLQDSGSRFLKESTARTVAASREKLRLLGLNQEQIQAIETRGTPAATVEIKSPIGGIVIQKNAEEGAYVKTGTPIYKLADLSTVWVKLNAYESDIARLRYGQEVDIRTEAYGDRVFPGWISFIDPVLNPRTRTVMVRVVVKNPDGLLRPNMFARAKVKVRLGDNEQVVTRNLQNKWICPMHPEVIKDQSGKCDACGMPLVKAETLGYADTAKVRPALVVPASAVLTTGARAIVYVRVPGRDKPTFEGVEIKIGPRAGNFYLVRSGLSAGQEVVTRGNFKIDSALQLLARPSMMNPERGGSLPRGHARYASGEETAKLLESLSNTLGKPAGKSGEVGVSARFRQDLQPLYGNYLKTQQALAADDEQKARQALIAMAEALPKVDVSLVKGEANMQWLELSGKLKEILHSANNTKGIAGLRQSFIALSKLVIQMEKTFGHTGNEVHRIMFCPMAEDKKGAEWLQLGEPIQNPFYGSAMLRCGELRQTLPGQNTE